MNRRLLQWLLGLVMGAAWLGAQAQTTVEYIHTDALGSVVAVTNAAGQVIERNDYEPYGAIIGKPSYGGVGFTGHVQDAATGLTYMQQRYYDPQSGLFLSIDPVTALSSPVEMFNRYRYANDSPYRFKDPDGRRIMSDSDRLRPVCQSDVRCRFGFQNGRSNADGKSARPNRESPIVTLDTVKAVAGAMFRVNRELVGKTNALPTTLVGVQINNARFLHGKLAGTNPYISFGNNAIQYHNLPVVGYKGAVAIGNTIGYGGSQHDARQRVSGLPLGYEEMQHTRQAEVLGGMYLPASIAVGAYNQLVNDDWHSPSNPLEAGPHGVNPRPWP